MLRAPLPTCDEYDPLNDHLDDLEEPGTNLLQDFVLRANDSPLVSNDTPLSISNGYTSEESDYSVATPSEEQMYSDMSFLQSAETSELVEVVADFFTVDDLTALSPQQQQVFAGKMIKGKTSKYRGVTQTSKTSWGAKYSAKRITNTCKTPDEAARAYDDYLRSNYPDKFAKFANFCARCDRFVNPLGLPEFKNECICDELSDHGSTEAESPQTDADEEQFRQQQYALAMGSDGIELRAGSNLSISSLKLSFLEDSEPLFDDATMLPSPQSNNDASVDGGDAKRARTVKRDSFTMAAVETFANDGSMDRIIKDIGRSSSSSSLTKKPSFGHSNSFGLHAPSSSGSTLVDFSPEEWQNFSDLLAEQAAAASSNNATQPTVQPNQNRSKYKKIHSLDFDSNESSDIHHNHQPQYDYVKEEYTSAMDVDDIASAFMPNPASSYNSSMDAKQLTPMSNTETRSSSAFPARVEMQTPFLEKYWRNDRKNIQCFPYCPEHGDYYRVRIENLQHRCKGVCRAAVKARIVIPTTQTLSPSGLVLLARCNSTFSRNVTLSGQQVLNAVEIKNLQAVSAVGVMDKFGVLPNGSGVQFEVTFYPDVWKFEFDLPKKRRHASGAEPEFEGTTSEFMYFFEIDVFYTTDKASFQRFGHAESMNFQIGNTRTLLRQRNRMTEEPSAMGGDLDRVMDFDSMPEKKKVKTYLGQLARSSTVDEPTEDGAMLSVAYITGEGVGKAPLDPTKPVDVDKLCRIDSKDSTFDMNSTAGAYGGSRLWTEGDDETTPAYDRYISPKNAVHEDHEADHAVSVAMGKSAAKTALGNERGPVPPGASEKQTAAHSWGKLFAYSVLSLPLSLVFVPLSLLLFVPFLVLPPVSGSIVRILDALSDSELRRANSSAISSDTRMVLNRLEADSTSGGRKTLQYHGKGDVWARFVYFCGVKLVISTVVLIPVIVLSVLGLVLYPIRPLSHGLLRAASSTALISREYTRKTVGKPFIQSGDAMV